MPTTDQNPRLDSAWHYQPSAGLYDEMLESSGEIRPHWRGLAELLGEVGGKGLAERWQQGRRLIRDNGVTYNVYGDAQTTERPWPLDPIPFLLSESERSAIETAIVQRATLLNRILADLYGPRLLLRDRKLPPELVFEHPGFLRPCSGLSLPGNVWIHSYAADLARSPDGQWWVLADRTQAPSGAGYALENRLVSLRVWPDLFRQENVRRLAPFFQAYRDTLRGLASKVENPRIVVLTPGPYNETYFEHAFLARYLGYTLVEGGDLTVRENRVFLKTLSGLLPVDVIVRRQDDTYCDPLELRADSILGVAGLLEAIRAGNVAVANALGSGLLESSAHSAFLPVLCRHILGEELKMPNIATWWCGDPSARAWVIDHLPNLVVKPASPSHDIQPVFGATLSTAERSALAASIEASPGSFVAQEQVILSTVPASRDFRLETRHLVLRVFAVASGGSYVVMPGGLSRVTSSLDNLVVSVQRGGGSKDTWAVASSPAPAFTLLRKSQGPLEVSRATFDLPSRVADNLFWLGRYLERFEVGIRAARAMPARFHQETDFANLAALDVCKEVFLEGGWLETAVPNKPLRESDFLDLACGDHPNGSVQSRVKEIRRLAWLLRDRMSADAWRVLKQLEQRCTEAPPAEPLRLSWAQDMLDSAIIYLSAFSGLATENMTRGYGWRFLDVGRRLERAVQTLQMVRRGLGLRPDPPDSVLAVLLEIADSTLTYRSRYLDSMQADLVVDLLLLDEDNPRSVAFQLADLVQHVDHLPESNTSSGRSREARLALRPLSAVRLATAADFTRTDDQGRMVDLERFAARLAEDLSVLSDSLTRVYFALSGPSRQLAHPLNRSEAGVNP